MGQTLLVTLREGLEAALIVAIVMAYLRSIGRTDQSRTVWLGVLAAVAISLAVGGAIFAAAGEFEGRAEQAFEGFTVLAAVVVLSWMIIWMKRQAADIRQDLQRDLSLAVSTGSLVGLALIPFVAVLREGLETAVFVFAATRTATPLESTIGAVVGLGIAVVLGFGIYSGGYRVNLRLFFNATGVLLIFFAAGMLAYGLHELQEASLAPVFVEHVWDVNHVLSDKEGVGEWLKGLFGYNGNPSLIEIIAYPVYLTAALWYFLGVRAPSPTPSPMAERSESAAR